MAEPVTTDSTTNLTILAEKTITPLAINLRIKAETPLAHYPLFDSAPKQSKIRKGNRLRKFV